VSRARRLRPGDPWGSPASGPPDVEISGDDGALAAVLDRTQFPTGPGLSVWFRPDAGSDLARAVGLLAGSAAGPLDVPVDALRLRPNGWAVNAVVLGTPPDRLRWRSRSRPIALTVDGVERFRGPATTVVIANGQFLRGADVVPRGHPGDGVIEVQVYALTRAERRAMRGRLAVGAHLPNPRIRQSTGTIVAVSAACPWPVEVDGQARNGVEALTVEVVPAALRLRI
jgi:putative lipid kinase YegS-like protein